MSLRHPNFKCIHCKTAKMATCFAPSHWKVCYVQQSGW